MNKKLLSICIPTFNRCEILDCTLNNLFSNPEFDENLIEVIVSDNCSTDNTFEIVKKYPLVRYYKNNINLVDKNFSIVLSYATGEYIRLFNDTLSFKEGALKKILNTIKFHQGDNVNLFFYRNEFVNKNCKLIINSKNKFIKEVSIYSTWIANFGCWKIDFEKINSKDRYAEIQFPQVDWCYRIVENTKKTIIYFDDFIDVIVPFKKGGYNIFDTFVNKYLYIIKRENFHFITYEIEKYRLLRYYIYPNLLNLLVFEKDTYDFEIRKPFFIIFKKYWYEPYFYIMIIFYNFKKYKS